jgi:hypothetical protein
VKNHHHAHPHGQAATEITNQAIIRLIKIFLNSWPSAPQSRDIAEAYEVVQATVEIAMLFGRTDACSPSDN